MSIKIIAYILLFAFFFLDFLIRDGRQAKATANTAEDNKSAFFLLVSFAFILLLAVLTGFFHFGYILNYKWALPGLIIMLAGFAIRIYSMLTLRRYYTRILSVSGKQTIVKKGIYGIIRHPGYLGTIMIWGACGLAMLNGVVLFTSLVLLFSAYTYRINNEEKMMQSNFKEEYAMYMKKTWRLIPFIW